MTVLKVELFQHVCNVCGTFSDYGRSRKIPEGWKIDLYLQQEDGSKAPGHICPDCRKNIEKDQPEKKRD